MKHISRALYIICIVKGFYEKPLITHYWKEIPRLWLPFKSAFVALDLLEIITIKPLFPTSLNWNLSWWRHISLIIDS